MRVLVTGSSGYLASIILPRLAEQREIEHIVGLDLHPPRDAAVASVEHVTGSIEDPALAELMQRARIDLVLHLAWVFNPTHDREAMRRVDVDGSRNVFESAHRAAVARLVYLSSTTAYGAHPDNPEWLTESAAARGNAGFAYAADKAAVERLLDEFEPAHPELAITRVRPCIVLGARTDNFVKDILELPLMPRIAGHDPEMQFLHEDDLADAIVRLVRHPACGAINIAPAETVRFSEMGPLLGRRTVPVPDPLLRMLVACGWWLRLLGAPASYLDFVKWRWVADVRKMRDVLGFQPKYSSRDAIRATLG